MNHSNDNAKHPLWDYVLRHTPHSAYLSKHIRGKNRDRAIENLAFFIDFQIAYEKTKVEINRKEIKVIT